jgi:N-acetylglutamate synthase-like GNAT family acetyltransferase
MIEAVTVRKAGSADYARITQLLTDAALPLEGLTGHDNFLVLCREDRIVGGAAIERYGKYGLLRSVALEPRERRRGFGRRLVENAAHQARRDASLNSSSSPPPPRRFSSASDFT